MCDSAGSFSESCSVGSVCFVRSVYEHMLGQPSSEQYSQLIPFENVRLGRAGGHHFD